ncbi:MAG: flagellar basal body rod protein FlgC [Zetaproteobacteria bacterium CG06_land_8_20_14_3_00_59_53]|nr:MAG: flagellar basal body rod protein FlgC [Zetaproteobacteria bacterium CG2_30_59_37]PIO90765.1 MAG: flagellar basal body rod protein FlgC [Zetaproteobacteria bacterium CG23_combo_of_CG06-09_8_20_14_all_59_86]PIQ65337.1 MAG: flagellar basal body rod protein FlgC [Zetaproteobacteria bacterium CG11_big_fil_rev_8_21_14_0_20_59_439]PIU69879.1 MAG: flagellar basal body rod protein FlgC [Zetaproteobacteria bacterium CG06_land_8_20_14_3_00_59_53]PIU97405.1 MAG: flagellar basal body rod protein Flg
MADTLFNAMNISAAGMSAQRSRLDIVAENIANAESTRTEQGGPYRRRQVVFKSTEIKPGFDSVFQSSFEGKGPKGVKVTSIIDDQRPFREVYNPGHPDADARGMVKMPNVNSVEEMVDMQSAARSFEANVTTMEAAKRMFQKSLELLR